MPSTKNPSQVQLISDPDYRIIQDPNRHAVLNSLFITDSTSGSVGIEMHGSGKLNANGSRQKLNSFRREMQVDTYTDLNGVLNYTWFPFQGSAQRLQFTVLNGGAATINVDIGYGSLSSAEIPDYLYGSTFSLEVYRVDTLTGTLSLNFSIFNFLFSGSDGTFPTTGRFRSKLEASHDDNNKWLMTRTNYL